MYERQADFAALVRAADPEGTFANDWLCARVLGGGKKQGRPGCQGAG